MEKKALPVIGMKLGIFVNNVSFPMMHRWNANCHCQERF
jgi:hypothetical protein